MPPRKSKTTLDEAIETVGDERKQEVSDAWLANDMQHEELDAAAKEAEDAAERRRQREEETTKGAQEERPIKKKKRSTRRARATMPTAGSDTDSVRDESPPPPPPPKRGRTRYREDDPRRNPPPSVANLLADRNASLERAASVSSTASTSTAKKVFYVDKTVMGDECLLIDGSEEEGVKAYVAQTLACGVCQEPYRRATRPPSGEVVKWPPGSADDEGQVLTPYVSTKSTSKAIKNLTQLTSYARYMRKKMRGETRVRFTKVKKAGVVDLLRRMPRHLLVPRAVRIANDFKESVGMFVDRKILKPSALDKETVAQDDMVDTEGSGEGVESAADVDEDMLAVGVAAEARFHAQHGICPGPRGSLIVADTGNHVIRMISNGIVTTIAGRPREAGHADGPSHEALFSSPMRVIVTPPRWRSWGSFLIETAPSYRDRRSEVVVSMPSGGLGGGGARVERGAACDAHVRRLAGADAGGRDGAAPARVAAVRGRGAACSAALLARASAMHAVRSAIAFWLQQCAARRYATKASQRSNAARFRANNANCLAVSFAMPRVWSTPAAKYS